MDVRLGSTGAPLTDAEIDGFAAKLTGELDHLSVQPSVATRRVGDEVEVTIAVSVDAHDHFRALGTGAVVISAGLRALGIGGVGRSELRCRVRPAA